MTDSNRKRWEWCLVAVSRSERETLGVSWVFSVDRRFARVIGGLCRIVILGRGIEIYQPSPPDFCSKNSRGHLIVGTSSVPPPVGALRRQRVGADLSPNIGRPSGPPPPVKPLCLLLVLL